MNNSHIVGAFGLCRKAGGCVVGEEATLKNIRAGKAFSVFLNSTASANTTKRFQDACSFHQVRLVVYKPEEINLSAAVGKESCKVLAIVDPNWSDSLLAKIDALHLEELN